MKGVAARDQGVPGGWSTWQGFAFYSRRVHYAPNCGLVGPWLVFMLLLWLLNIFHFTIMSI